MQHCRLSKHCFAAAAKKWKSTFDQFRFEAPPIKKLARRVKTEIGAGCENLLIRLAPGLAAKAATSQKKL